jgi:hypothetical protein
MLFVILFTGYLCLIFHLAQTLLRIPCKEYPAKNTLQRIPCKEYPAKNTLQRIPCKEYPAKNTLQRPCKECARILKTFSRHDIFNKGTQAIAN